jgi:hypothetical protein
MMQTKIDKYFESKGIKTIFNCLGNNEKLVRAYVGNFRQDTDNHKSHNSQYTKVGTYNKMWTMQPRHKMTGFELLKDQDQKFRKSVQNYIMESQNSPLFLVNNDEHDNSLSYKQALIEFVKTIENPLVYLSGGLDSELVACAMIEAGVRFNVVIFEWTNNGNHIINSQEIFHAYRFCKKHGLIPTIRQINIEKLWDSDYFKRLAIDAQIQSPHLVTYTHAVKVMSLEYPNSTHVFGGEVKFKSNYKLDNGEDSNLVWLDKLLPAYNGNTYQANAATCDDAFVRLFYYGANFGARVRGEYGIQLSNVPNLVETGFWTDTPSAAYERRVTNITLNSGTTGLYQTQPAVGSTPQAWTLITSAGLGLNIVAEAYVFTPGYGSFYFISATFDIEVRVVGETTPVQASNITLNAFADCF